MSRNAARGALLGIAGQAWHLVTAFLLYKLLSNELGLSLFGQWRLVVSLLVWFEIFVNSGLVKMATKELTERPDDHEPLVRATYLGQAFVAVCVFALTFVAAGPISAVLHDPPLANLLRIAALDIPIYAAFMAASSIRLGSHGYERQAIGWIIYATAKLVLIAGLVWAGFSIAGALVGNALSSLVGFAAVIVLWGPGKADFEQLRTLAAELLVTSTPFLVLALLEGLGASADLWLVAGMVSTGVLLTYYASAATLAEMPTFLLVGVNRVLFPSVTTAGAEGDSEKLGRIAAGGLRVAIMITVLAVAVIAATGRTALRFAYNTQFEGAYLPLVILMVASVGRASRAACTEVLLATDRSRTAIMVLVGSIAIEVVLLLALTPRFGIVGAAIGAAIAGLIAGAWAAITLRDEIGWRPLGTLVRSAFAAAVVGGALWWVAPHQPSVLALLAVVLLGYPLAAAAFLGILRLLGEFDAEDIAVVRSAMAR